jgi:hypothetical protein
VVFADEICALINALVADIYTVWAANDFFNFACALAAETAMLFLLIIVHKTSFRSCGYERQIARNFTI